MDSNLSVSKENKEDKIDISDYASLKYAPNNIKMDNSLYNCAEQRLPVVAVCSIAAKSAGRRQRSGK